MITSTKDIWGVQAACKHDKVCMQQVCKASCFEGNLNEYVVSVDEIFLLTGKGGNKICKVLTKNAPLHPTATGISKMT